MGRNDNSNGFFFSRSLANSPAWRGLNGTAMVVYMDLLMRCQMQQVKTTSGKARQWVIKNNGELAYPYREAAKRGIHSNTFTRALDALVEHGLVDITYQGNGRCKGDFSKYAISERWKRYGRPDFEPARRAKDLRSNHAGFQPGNGFSSKRRRQA